MFHRRLLLLLGASAAAFGALAVQLTNLTALEGRALRLTAESKLVRQRWTPTIRGRILDRKGRILAEDRPSFAAKVKYDVIARPGESSAWARLAAASTARRRNAAIWAALDDAGREELIGRYRAIYDAHVAAMWSRLAGAAGVSPEVLGERQEKVRAEVERQKRSVVAQALKRDYRRQLQSLWKPAGPRQDAAAREAEIEARASSVARNFARSGGAPREDEGLALLGPPPDEAFLDRAAAKGMNSPIAEEGRPGRSTRDRLSDHRDGPDAHALASRLSDAQGFALFRMADEDVELDVGRADLPAPSEGRDRLPPTETVDLMPGLVVADAGDRAYPFDACTVTLDRGGFPGPLRTADPLEVAVEGVACHILGNMRSDVHKEDPRRRAGKLAEDPAFAARVLAPGAGGEPTDRGAYRDGDWVGDTGVEGSREDALRGLRGLRTWHVDTTESGGLEPVHGLDVRLTIDAMLQARILAAMSPEAGLAVVQPWQGNRGGSDGSPPMPPGTPLNGAAVVLDIATGDILALVSTPSYSHERLRQEAGAMKNDTANFPFVNKAIARPYPPGSIAKAIILCGAVSRGEYRVGERIPCTGHLFPNNRDKFRCWVYREQYGFTTHSARLGHDLDAAEALMVSCNIFYFTLGRRLGAEGIVDTYTRFGLGDRWDLGVGIEYAGQLGRKSPDAPRGVFEPCPIEPDEATMMGIGQGPVDWTPLHAADAFATLARAGIRIQPRLIEDPAAPRARRDIGLDLASVAAAMDGLHRSVNEHDGTGNHLVIDGRPEPVFNVPGVEVWGKTGTAQSWPVRADSPAGPNTGPILRDGDHSWFVVLVGPRGSAPTHSIAVMMEYSGSGGKVSGPIVNQVIHALVDEGYLGGDPRAGCGAPDAGLARAP